MDLYIKPSDNSVEEKLLLKTDGQKTEERTKDGHFLLFTSKGPKTNSDLWALSFPGETKTQQGISRVSPDGRWLAYRSSESSTSGLFVRPFAPDAPAGTGAKWMVSKGVGAFPTWRPDGKQLFYVSPDAQMMAVDIDTSKGFQASPPLRLFTVPSTATLGWDVSPDGRRFLFAAPPSLGHVIPFTVVLNWAAGLKK
jgi:Tol biopolymer transport system component